MKLPPTLCLAAALAASAAAAEPPILAKARAFLGSEAALDGVVSLHMTGTFSESSGAAGAASRPPEQVDIIYQKPWRHRLVVRSGKVVRTIGLDGYDAWARVVDPSDPLSPRITLYSPSAIEALRADVWENLGYYRGLEEIGGAVKDEGPAKVDGVACEKVAFIHESGLVYTRYFDLATGRLVFTETGTGLKIRESGSIESGGIRFPKEIVTAEPGSRTTTLVFDTITVNERFPDDTFTTPLPPLVPTAPQPAAAGP